MKLKGKAKAAFLRRMARGRNKTAPRKRRKHKHHTEAHVKRGRRRHHSKKHHSKGRRRSHGSIGKYIPDQARLVGLGAAFAYGKVEAAASKDTQHVLNKVPSIIAQIGRAGNLGAILWLGGVITRHPVVKSVASGVLHVAAYQNGRNGGTFTKDAPDFKMGAPRPGRGRDEMMVEDYLRQRGGG